MMTLRRPFVTPRVSSAVTHPSVAAPIRSDYGSDNGTKQENDA
jgi:hypothetical protein